MAFERGFDALYGLEMVGPGLGEDGIVRGRVRVRAELLGAEGRLHGGVPAAIAESLASQGTALVTVEQGLVPSGLSNDTTVIAAVAEGTMLHAEASRSAASRTTGSGQSNCAMTRTPVCLQPRHDRRSPVAPLTGGCPCLGLPATPIG